MYKYTILLLVHMLSTYGVIFGMWIIVLLFYPNTALLVFGFLAARFCSICQSLIGFKALKKRVASWAIFICIDLIISLALLSLGFLYVFGLDWPMTPFARVSALGGGMAIGISFLYIFFSALEYKDGDLFGKSKRPSINSNEIHS